MDTCLWLLFPWILYLIQVAVWHSRGEGIDSIFHHGYCGWVGLRLSPLCLKIIPCIRKMYKTPLFRSLFRGLFKMLPWLFRSLFRMLQSFHTFIDVSAFSRGLNGVFYFFFPEGEQLVNHIPNINLLTTKLGLLSSLQEYQRVQDKMAGRSASK